MKRTYTELKKLKTFEERFAYLKLDSSVGIDTFGYDRYLNQKFYNSTEWKKMRNYVILRDQGCDLGIDDREISGKVFIHHMNPIAVSDIKHSTENLLNPEFLVCVSFDTHNAIHYGTELPTLSQFAERTKNDTIPWR